RVPPPRVPCGASPAPLVRDRCPSRGRAARIRALTGTDDVAGIIATPRKSAPRKPTPVLSPAPPAIPLDPARRRPYSQRGPPALPRRRPTMQDIVVPKPYRFVP